MPKGQPYLKKYMKKRYPQLLEGKRYFSSNIWSDFGQERMKNFIVTPENHSSIDSVQFIKDKSPLFENSFIDHKENIAAEKDSTHIKQ